MSTLSRPKRERGDAACPVEERAPKSSRLCADSPGGCSSSSDSVSSECYTPLGPGEFRLMRIDSADPGDSQTEHFFTYISLVRQSLEDCPEYTALSYAWGVENGPWAVLSDTSRIFAM